MKQFKEVDYVLAYCPDKFTQGYHSAWVSPNACAGGCEYAIIGKKNRIGEQLIECKLKKEKILIKRKVKKREHTKK